MFVQENRNVSVTNQRTKPKMEFSAFPRFAVHKCAHSLHHELNSHRSNFHTTRFHPKHVWRLQNKPPFSKKPSEPGIQLSIFWLVLTCFSGLCAASIFFEASLMTRQVVQTCTRNIHLKSAIYPLALQKKHILAKFLLILIQKRHSTCKGCNK